VPNLSGAQQADPRQASTEDQAQIPSPAPGQQVSSPEEAVAAAAGANQQWQPRSSFQVLDNSQRVYQLPDQAPQNQADMKGDMTRTYHVAFSGTTQPTLSSDEQTPTSSDRPPGHEPHRTAGQSATKNKPTNER
jgi:hypothetical protein